MLEEFVIEGVFEFLLFDKCWMKSGRQGITECQIIVSPVGNTTVPAGSDVNITYSCTVPDGTFLEWVFQGIQIIPGSDIVQIIAQNGLLLDPPTQEQMTSIIITRLARERFRTIELRCSSFDFPSVIFGEPFYVRTFGEYK